MVAAYRIKLPVFEGPFDLLLHLVRVNEMDLHDIAISEITRQYLAYIDLMREMDLEVAGEFLVMAATLISLKARTLLPVPPDPEEQEDELDEVLSARQLVRQLVEYRRFKEAAATLRGRETEAARVLYRTVAPPRPPEPEDDAPPRVELDLLFKAFARVLRYVDSPAYDPHIHESFTVEAKIGHLRELLAVSGTLDLEQELGRCLSRLETIVTFLAVLELCRMKKVSITQEAPFDPISLTALAGDLDEDDMLADEDRRDADDDGDYDDD